jgi:hypothetical protein
MFGAMLKNENAGMRKEEGTYPGFSPESTAIKNIDWQVFWLVSR